MNTLEIIKASAGSGKTWTLAREYLKILIPTDGTPFDPQAFRHILAVTFTNKATEEMKSRIIDELHKLIQDPGYCFPDKEPRTEQAREYAEKALTAILHDYGSFSVSTIDRFFQIVMRAFAREINQYASYKVELDTDSVLQQTVDRMLASLDEPGNEELLKWLTDYSLEQIEQGKKWDISGPLYDICKHLVNEEFLRLRRKYGPELWDRQTITEFQNRLRIIIDSEGEGKVKSTAKSLNEDIYLLGIVADLYRNLTELLKENNLVLLSESTDVLSRIIDGSDTPFIYEKVGTRYDHFMLDEFQDTSRLQWENFKPLLKDTIDRGEGSLVVGDIKQSIYRFRGSDMNLLHSEVAKLLPNPQDHIHTRKENWRSEETIVDFNNKFFCRLNELLQKMDSVKGFASEIAGYYQKEDVKQDVAREENKGKGYVRVEFLTKGPKKESPDYWTNIIPSRLKEFMEELVSRYPRYSDIAFLVRSNDEGATIAETLLSLNYPVVTEDSLMLSSSKSIKRLAALLTFLADPSNSVNLTLMKELFDEIPNLSAAAGESDSLYEICDTLLRKYMPVIPESEQPFLFAFLDEVIAYTDKFGSNLTGFVEWWQKSGYQRKISAPKRDDAITVMTIHKAKGLDFQVVVIPFLDEALLRGNPILWCEPQGDFSSIGLVPVKAKKDLIETIFADDFAKEQKMQCLDAINTAYVAMTRAVKEMYIFAPAPKLTTKGVIDSRCNTVATMLYLHLQPANVRLGEPYDLEFGRKESGDAPVSVPAVQSKPVRFRSIPYDERLRLSLKGGEFFSTERGIRYHDILSRIDTEADLHGAVADAVREGLLSADEAVEAEKEIGTWIGQVADRHWFDGSWRALNEISIVDAAGEIHRPDRVLVEKGKPLGQGKALVIDYKFGEEHDKYRKQVRRYMNLLFQMGYSDVSGLLWYCPKNLVKDVE